MKTDKQPESEENPNEMADEPEVVEESASESGVTEPASGETVPGDEGPQPDGESSETGELLKRLNEAEEAARANQEKYLRTVADMENFRRRAAREREDLRDMAVASVIEDLLPAMDNLRLGLQSADNHPEAKEVAYGFRMVADQLKKTLESYGLTEEEPTGKTFDPNLHDCVAHQADEEVPEGEVIQTIRPGFRLKKRLLRAASVIVSSGPPAEGDAS